MSWLVMFKKLYYMSAWLPATQSNLCTSKLHTWSVCKGWWVKSGVELLPAYQGRIVSKSRFPYTLELVCTPRGKRATHPILFPSSLTPILATTHSPTLRMPARDKSEQKTHVLCYAYSCCCCCWFFERHSSCHLSVVYGSQSTAVKERGRGWGGVFHRLIVLPLMFTTEQ